MRMRFALGILGPCFISLGCYPVALATRTCVIEPIQYCKTADDIQERRRDYAFAEETWQMFAQAHPDHPASLDYESGFKDGFADYLYAGGTGEPPPVPPRQYWRVTYETPQGHQAIQDWFDGFRHGATVARDSGYREGVTIPSSLLSPNAPHLFLPSTHPESIAMPSNENVLPPPKEIPALRSPENSK
jgi:hypothetical protein